MQEQWTIHDSAELYKIPYWGTPYFSVNEEGNLMCLPRGTGRPAIDLKSLVDDLQRRGIQSPILIRFDDILKDRIDRLYQAFRQSSEEYGYRGKYRAVLPIKVNQQRHVVEELMAYGRPRGFGLEAGSKPELLVCIGLLQEGDLLICNGYKDRKYIETALYAQRLGIQPHLVLDRFAELNLVLAAAKELGVRPNIGIRAKLFTKGAGRWKQSTGYRSKFGLSAREMVRAVETLRDEGMLDCLKTLHFHIGSQITAIRSVKDAVREATHLYCHLRRMGASELTHIDVGGGLAVDYDGSQTNFHSSKNYSMQEYANDVVWTVMDICDATDEPHPTLLTEAGRALVAHHAVLVFNLLGIHRFTEIDSRSMHAPADDDHNAVHAMWEAYSTVTNKNFQEAYNDVVQLREETATLFNHGVIDLESRARAEDLFWATCERIQRVIQDAEYVPEDLETLDRELSDTYYCNFSVFQSLPDSWAVGHLFPVIPIQRLDEQPKRDAVVADLTCDSDGKLDRFIDLRDVRHTLPVHCPNGEPYYLAAFLVGAYQEILGDLHNLFGDTNAVHVSVDDSGGYRLEHLVDGDRVSEVLGYVEFDRSQLLERVRANAEAALRAGRLCPEELRHFVRLYEKGLAGYTYLEDTPAPAG
jgi:arginine decarboxylase